MGNHKNAELKEILLKRKAEREKNQKPKQEDITISEADKFREKQKIKQEQFKKEIELKKQNDPNFRDYDENPLIIKSYERYIVAIFLLSNWWLTTSICVMFYNIYKKNSNNVEYIYLFAMTLCLIVGMFLYDKFRLAGHKIKFTNQYIEFIDNGKSKRKCDIVVDEIVRPFYQSYCKTILTPIVYIIIFIASIKTYGLAFVVILICYLSNIVVKSMIYLLINKNLKGFKIFPFIQIAEPAGDYHGKLNERYYMIYLFDNEVYREVKKYFLQKSIDIDRLPKKMTLI
ncbi:MAG: hypothetical protein IJM31_03975 [Campylobacter sp.]|nr:hypothetical protein [Campylobacter sp.]